MKIQENKYLAPPVSAPRDVSKHQNVRKTESVLARLLFINYMYNSLQSTKSSVNIYI